MYTIMYMHSSFADQFTLTLCIQIHTPYTLYIYVELFESTGTAILSNQLDEENMNIVFVVGTYLDSIYSRN